jgi:hypothetical protein
MRKINSRPQRSEDTSQKLRVMPPPNPVARTLPRFKPQIVQEAPLLRSRVKYSRKGGHREPLA